MAETPHVTPAVSHSPTSPAAKSTSAGKTTNDGPYDHLIGLTDLQPGEACWLLLDTAGVGISLQRDPPDPGIPACAVRVNANQQGGVFQGLLSITGSELGAVLQPNPDNRLVLTPPAVQGAAIPAHVAAAATPPKHAEQPKK